MASTRTRSVIKAVTWRSLSIVLTTLFVWAVSRKVGVAIAVLAFDLVVMTGMYYTHERVWKSIKWGKFPTDWREHGWHKDEDTKD